jgi:hypothetical protein
MTVHEHILQRVILTVLLRFVLTAAAFALAIVAAVSVTLFFAGVIEWLMARAFPVWF